MIVVSKERLDKPNLPIATIEKENNTQKEDPVGFVYVMENRDDNPQAVKEIDGKFEMLPYIEPNQRQAVYISGVSGSGKSTSAVTYIKKLRKSAPKYKNYPTYLWTANSIEDTVFKDLKNTYRINIEDYTNLADLSYTEFENCIVVFDDWEALERPMLVYFRDMMKKLLEYSRKQNVVIIVITHMTQQGLLTKPIIFECDTFILYHRNNFNACRKFLQNYMDLDNDVMDKVKKMHGRCIYVRKSFPTCIISENKILLL